MVCQIVAGVVCCDEPAKFVPACLPEAGCIQCWRVAFSVVLPYVAAFSVMLPYVAVVRGPGYRLCHHGDAMTVARLSHEYVEYSDISKIAALVGALVGGAWV